MIAVIGAGAAGLACAARLVEAGREVRVFDKGRRPGGRIATRRIGDVSFNHGAQFATARDPAFVALLARFQQDGTVAGWPAASDGRDVRWVGVPGMSAMATALVGSLTVETLSQVAFIRPDRSVRIVPADTIAPGVVCDEGGSLTEPFEAVLLAVPSPQAVLLLGDHPFAARAAATRYVPSWTVMATFDPALPGPDVFRAKTGAVGWAARQSSLPGHSDGPDAWVIQATAAWSAEHLEQDAAKIAPMLCAAFTAVVPATVAAQRWRYAQVEAAAGEPCLWDPKQRIGACGDWCLGGRVEAAWLSGRALAAAVLA